MKRLACIVLLLMIFDGTSAARAQVPAWPDVTSVSRPWTRWWWHGSAVDEPGLKAALEAYREAGLGGVEITPIYGVAGYEDRFVDYLSPAWMERLVYTLREAARLGLGVDLNNGTGWPFGGPWVGAEDAAKYVAYQTYHLRGGERLGEPVMRRQEPLLRAVGTQVYELHGILKPEGEEPQGTMAQPLRRPGAEKPDLDRLREPIAANENLQALALDQVRFPKEMPLVALVVYSAAGDVHDLTAHVGPDGRLDWTAPEGDWTLYAVFQGWHGKMVERAAPGGEGYAIDHFSQEALDGYLTHVGRAFEGYDLQGLRAFFNDSYEVDDAQGEADWTPAFFDEFRQRRGYDLRAHLPALFGRDTLNHARVLTDYRQTISDLLLDRFTEPWRAWAHGRGAITRNQAHGSPANILDLYAASDIPETEGTNLLRIKLASSAAHVTGKRLVSAEAATWLDEHFLANLADVKRAVDRYLLGGVNHIVYHGTAYSPQDAPWPGWLFYAAVHFQPVNPLWSDFAALNRYVARAQSFLQDGRPDNDVLLYLPMSDRYAEPGTSLLVHVDGMGAFEGMPFAADAGRLLERGYGFDFISDRRLRDTGVRAGRIVAGDVGYRTVVVPEAGLMPVETLEQLLALAEAGATVVFHRQLPVDVPGLHDLERRQARLRALLGTLSFDAGDAAGVRTAKVGAGKVLVGGDLDALLAAAAVPREPMVDQGLQFVRRSRAGGHDYFIANVGETAVDGWVPVAVDARSAALYDPMTGAAGIAKVRTGAHGEAEVYLQLAPGETVLLHTQEGAMSGAPFPYVRPAGPPQPVDGTWRIHFAGGGPVLPPGIETEQLVSWTELGGDAVKAFSGTATYTLAFAKPEGRADAWVLDLGRVHESARVRLNGVPLDTLIGPHYRVRIPAGQLQARNVLEVDVSNLMANRIAQMDREQAPWKRFYNVNFPALLRENRNENGLFEAAHWAPRPSGLLGPVTLTPVDFF